MNDTKTIACEFAKWLYENGFELMWSDKNNDGRVWSDIYDKTLKRYTIEEIYNDFLINTDRI